MDAIPETHCPFECSGPYLDENGYCHHLLGFTNDGRMFEPLDPILTAEGTPTGRYRVLGGKRRQPVDLSKHRLVNPEYKQLVNGVSNTAKRWVSARVYCKRKGDVPAPEIEVLADEPALT